MTRWNSRYASIKCASEKKFDPAQEPLFDQTRQIIREVSSQIEIIQRDCSSVKDVGEAFHKILVSWENNPTLSSECKRDLLKLWKNRLQMFLSTPLGNACNYLKNFIYDAETEVIFDRDPEINGIEAWTSQLLPRNNLEIFKREVESLQDLKTLGQPVTAKNIPIHKTLSNVLLKVVVSEASVERAFSRHKLFHSNLRASLSATKLDD